MNGPARAPWPVFAAVALGTFMATLDSSIVNVALPTLATRFGAGVTQIEWVSLAYVLTKLHVWWSRAKRRRREIEL